MSMREGRCAGKRLALGGTLCRKGIGVLFLGTGPIHDLTRILRTSYDDRFLLH